MRGFGQIAELTAICEPDVGVITNIGPVHLEQMGSLEGVARAKAELLVGMRDGAVAVVPGGRAAARRRTCATRSRSSRSAPGGDVPARCRDGRRARVIARRRAARARAAVPLAPQPASTRSPPWPRRGRSACAPAGAWTCASARCAASASRSRAARPSSTTATTPTRSRCAPPWTTSPCRSPPDGASRCSATCSSSGRRERAHHAEIGAVRGRRGRRRADRRRAAGGGDARAVRRRGARASPTRAAAARARARARRARATSCSSRARAASGSRSWPRRSRRERTGAGG